MNSYKQNGNVCSSRGGQFTLMALNHALDVISFVGTGICLRAKNNEGARKLKTQFRCAHRDRWTIGVSAGTKC